MIKRNRKLLILLVAVIVISILFIGGLQQIKGDTNMLQNIMFKHIEDTNGEEVYTLQTITDENIIKMDIGNKGLCEKTNEASKTYSSKKFSGVYEAYNTNFEAKYLKISVDNFKVNSGNIKYVLLVNNEIVYEFIPNEPNQSYTIKDVKGNAS